MRLHSFASQSLSNSGQDADAADCTDNRDCELRDGRNTDEDYKCGIVGDLLCIFSSP